MEFGLLAPVFAAALMLSLDVGNAYRLKLRVVAATNAAAQYALSNSQLMTASTAATFATNIQTVATSVAAVSPAPTVTVLFNNASGATNAGNFYCLTNAAPPTWTSTGTSSGSCGANVMSGKFVSISVSANANGLWSSDPIIGSVINATDSAIVRVE